MKMMPLLPEVSLTVPCMAGPQRGRVGNHEIMPQLRRVRVRLSMEYDAGIKGIADAGGPLQEMPKLSPR